MMRTVISIVFLLVSLVPVLSSLAEETGPPPEIRAVDVGIEGYYKSGQWTPVKISWIGSLGSGGLGIETVDSDGTHIATVIGPEWSYKARQSETEEGTLYTLTAYVRLGQANAPLNISLSPCCTEGTNLTIRPNDSPNKLSTPEIVPGKTNVRFAKPSLNDRPLNDRPIFLVLGEENLGIQEAVNLMRQRENRRPIPVSVTSFENLPDDHRGYESVSLLVINTSDPDFFEGITSDDLRIKAIERWLKSGGHVFMNAGRNSERLISGDSAPLKAFVPGNYREMRTLRQTLPLELFAGSSRSIHMDGSDLAPFLRFPYLDSVEGVSMLNESDAPLIVRTPIEFGLLTYFACDLSGSPLVHWRDRGLLVFRILNLENMQSSGSGVSGGQILSHLGYTDLSGQIRSSLDEFKGVGNTPFSIILILIFCYLLLISVGDRFLVKVVFKKPLLSWFTFPLWTVLFCVLAWYLGMFGRAEQFETNRLDLVDYDLASGSVRCSSWFGLYSPDDAVYTIDMTPQPKGIVPEADEQAFLIWHGLPGRAIGGMDPQTVSPAIWDRRYYHKSDRLLLENVPLQTHSSKSFFAQWSASGSLKTPQKPLFDKDGIPVGTFVNETGARLEKCLLIYGRWVMEVGTAEPGEAIELGTHLYRRDIKYILSSPNLVFDPNKIVKDQAGGTYSNKSRDLDYILRAMSFNYAVGGADATGLSNMYQSWSDLSNLLSANRAILIATVPEGTRLKYGSELNINEQSEPEGSRNKTIVRFIFPVEK